MSSASLLSTAQRLKRLREELGLNKKQIASPADVEPLAVTMWEKEKEQGGSVPRAETFIKLARFAQDKGRLEDALWLWQQAGIDIKALRALAPEIDKSFKQRERPAAEGENIDIPLIDRVESGKDRTDLAFPASLIGVRAEIKYARLSHGGMEPTFRRGDIFIIDESEKDAWKLKGCWVAFQQDAASNIKPGAFSNAIEEVVEEKIPTSPISPLEAANSKRLMVGMLHPDRFGQIDTLMLEIPKGAKPGTWLATVGVGLDFSFLGKRTRKLFHGTQEQLREMATPGWTVIGRVVAWIRPAAVETERSKKRRK
jgi:DNA-binding XRE family transcriptional regulator